MASRTLQPSAISPAGSISAPLRLPPPQRQHPYRRQHLITGKGSGQITWQALRRRAQFADALQMYRDIDQHPENSIKYGVKF